MSLGVCCQWVAQRQRARAAPVTYNAMEERRLQFGRWKDGGYTDARIVATYVSNANNLARMAPTIGGLVKCFRMSSCLLPLLDLVDPSLYDNVEVRQALAAAGAAFRAQGIRLTTHPGQFCVLSSDSDKVVERTVAELTSAAWIMDALGMPRSPYAAINIHGGKKDATQRLIDSIVDLPEAVRSRLTLENDEMSYSTVELLAVYLKTGTPVVFDSHHHSFNPDHLTVDEAYRAACETWPAGVRPLQHVSNTEPGFENGTFSERRRHGPYIYQLPDPQLEGVLADAIDLEVETTMKNLAVERLLDDLARRCGYRPASASERPQ